MKRICALIATVAVGMLGVVACGDDDEEAKTETVTTEEKQATGAPQDCPAGQIWAIALKKCVDENSGDHPVDHVHGPPASPGPDVSQECPAGEIWAIALKKCVEDNSGDHPVDHVHPSGADATQDCPANQIWAIALKKCVDVDTRAHPPEHVHGGGTASAGDGGCPAGYTEVIATGGCAMD